MRFNRGDTFDFAGPVTVKQNGVVIDDLTGWSARSQVRTGAGDLLAELVVEWLTRNPASIRVTCAESTQLWPGGDGKIDVEFTTPSGAIVSTKTQTFGIDIDTTREL